MGANTSREALAGESCVPNRSFCSSGSSVLLRCVVFFRRFAAHRRDAFVESVFGRFTSKAVVFSLQKNPQTLQKNTIKSTCRSSNGVYAIPEIVSREASTELEATERFSGNINAEMPIFLPDATANNKKISDVQRTASDNKHQPLIQVRNLTKYYHGDLILNNISVDIEEGDLVSIIGPSGCGKSTFLRCLNGMEVLGCGSVDINGISLQRKTLTEPLTQNFNKKAHALRQQVGMVFQTFNLFPHKTLLQNVMMAPMIVQKKSRDEAEAIAIRFLDKVGLKAFSHRYPVQLSGGQQQRGAIARALALSPKVMLYDEPTSAIDPTRVDEVLEVMRDLDKEGMTQIVVTHEMRFAKDASDYIIYMEQGEFVEISDEDEIFVAPKDERTRRFLKKFM